VSTHRRASGATAVGLVALSVGLAATGTWLSIRTATVPLPPGTERFSAPVLGWAMLGFTAVGGLVAARRPTHPVGWLLLASGLLWQLDLVAGDVRIHTGLAHPGLPGTAASAWAYDVVWIPATCALPLLALLFPSGSLPGARWRLALGSLGAGAGLLFVAVGLRPGPLTSTPFVDNPLGVVALADVTGRLEAIGNPLVALSVLAAFGSLLSRYRGGDVTTRQQVKWFLLAIAVVVASLAAANVLEAFGAADATLAATRLTPLVLVPAACGIALLRHGLFDIDVVIGKVVVYGALAAGIVVLYVAVVVGAGRLVGGGDEPNLALAVAATATAAIVFDPARRRLRRLANRAVYGRRASPYEALASMTRRVGAGYAGDEVLGRMARAIAEATGGRGEVWVAGPGGSVRAAAWPVTAGPDGQAAVDAIFPVRHNGEVLGALTVTKPRGAPVTPAEERLLADLADSAAFMLENARLVVELRASRQRLVAAQDGERRRVERDLHDGAQQRLLELALTLRRTERQIATNGGDAAATIAEAHGQLQQALAELRDLARGIHPAILTEQGLPAALASLADRSSVPVELHVHVPDRLDGTVESTAYFLTSEALSNVAKHSGAGTVRVTVTQGAGLLSVEISDDGTGGADAGGAGLQGLSDRVSALGGRFDVDSTPGDGTRVRAVVPCG
jgi:signal transduction histidine kinase